MTFIPFGVPSEYNWILCSPRGSSSEERGPAVGWLTDPHVPPCCWNCQILPGLYLKSDDKEKALHAPPMKARAVTATREDGGNWLFDIGILMLCSPKVFVQICCLLM